ncbi:hypothetical protein DFR74_1084 [Nocardia puris]|uniref:Uncharacterized protein n=1 Tax=Nocardia puris TaxID=208602 RepID=A0A366DFE6_9NOCA|nr:hypothetical protein DFR74_1084 [Nocardia puris]
MSRQRHDIGNQKRLRREAEELRLREAREIEKQRRQALKPIWAKKRVAR